MYRSLIAGKLVSGGAVSPVVNPVDESIAAEVSFVDRAQIDTAVETAKLAWPAWRNAAPEARTAVLKAISKAIRDNFEELAGLLILETGRPVAIAQFEVDLACRYLEYYAGVRLEPEILVEEEGRRVELHRKPLGVVAAIVPWNAPLYLAANKIGPALAAGNCVIVKPAPTTPLTSLRLGELIADIIPPGVVAIVATDNEGAAHLVAHPDIVKVAFTGSTQTGKAIMGAVSPQLKRLTLELGGNDAAIVLPDADVAVIAPALFGLAFFNSGQVCAVIKRLYVHDSLYDDVCDAIGEMARATPVGDGADPAVQFGPVQNRIQYDKVLTYLDCARSEGKIIAGGEPIDGPGYFIPLTVVRDVSDGDAIVDEEPFGPILPIIRYSDIDDVLARANASPFGLGASIWSSDTAQAAELATRLESGTVWVNQHCALDPAVPFPAHKESGLGVEGGIEGLHAYTALQVINIALPIPGAAA